MVLYQEYKNNIKGILGGCNIVVDGWSEIYERGSNYRTLSLFRFAMKWNNYAALTRLVGI